MNRAPMTKAGADRLRKELSHLKTVVRPEVIAAISEARAHGDLKENAEYHAAREQQSFTEGRIKELEYNLSHAQIIDISKLNPGSKVVFGAKVELEEIPDGKSVTYQIVGDLEADTTPSAESELPGHLAALRHQRVAEDRGDDQRTSRRAERQRHDRVRPHRRRR